MKKKKNIFLSSILSAFLILLFFSSCKKTDKVFSVTGHIIEGCPNTPISNFKVQLFLEPDTSAGDHTGKVLDEVTTDGSGAFILKTTEVGVVSMRYSDGTVIIPGLLSSEPSHKYLKIFKGFETTLQVIIHTSSNYTPFDTLYTTIPDGSGKYIKQAGPFFNGVLKAFPGYKFSNVVRNEDALNSHPAFTYHLNNDSVYTVRYSLAMCDTSSARITLP